MADPLTAERLSEDSVIAVLRAGADAAAELSTVRATLLVNYGPEGRSKPGLVSENQSTIKMLVAVLESQAAEVARLETRLAEIRAGAEADAADLETMRDGTKLTRAGLVMCIVYQRQDIKELKAEVARLTGERDEAKKHAITVYENCFKQRDELRAQLANVIEKQKETMASWKEDIERLAQYEDLVTQRDAMLAAAQAEVARLRSDVKVRTIEMDAAVAFADECRANNAKLAAENERLREEAKFAAGQLECIMALEGDVATLLREKTSQAATIERLRAAIVDALDMNAAGYPREALMALAEDAAAAALEGP